jgi:transcriptional regulator with XRE-family HTH domain
MTNTQAHSKQLIEEFGRKFRILRELQGLTQDDVGARAGVTGPQICKLEKGAKINVQLETLVSIAESIGFEIGLTLEPKLIQPTTKKGLQGARTL